MLMRVKVVKSRDNEKYNEARIYFINFFDKQTVN